MKASMFLAFVCVMGFVAGAAVIGCSGDDDDDDDSAGDDDATDDDAAAGCTQQTLCEYAVGCGYLGSVEQCVSDAEDCVDLAGETECSCACLNAGYDACSDEAYQCGAACVEAHC